MDRTQYNFYLDATQQVIYMLLETYFFVVFGGTFINFLSKFNA